MNCSDIRKLMHIRYAAPEWALFEEVANGTGGSIKRYADAIAVGLFPSRGLSIQGFEIKVSRSDLKSELMNPEKAEEIAQYCDRWWIVAPAGMVKPEELPETWGLVEAYENCLRNKKEAAKLEAKPLTRKFFCALARRAHEVNQSTLNGLIAARTQEQADQFYKKQQEMIKARDEFRGYSSKAARYDELIKNLKEIEDKTGVNLIDQWHGHTDFLRAAEFVKKTGVLQAYQGIASIQELLKNNLEKIDKAMADHGVG